VAKDVEQLDRGVSFFIWFALFTAAGAFFLAMLTSTSREQEKVLAKRDETARKLARVEASVHELKEEIKAMENDPEAIEREARKLNYARPGEVSYPRENIPLKKVTASAGPPKKKQLSTFVRKELKDWQVPLTVFVVIIVALLIVRVFAPSEGALTPESPVGPEDPVAPEESR